LTGKPSTHARAPTRPLASRLSRFLEAVGMVSERLHEGGQLAHRSVGCMNVDWTGRAFCRASVNGSSCSAGEPSLRLQLRFDILSCVRTKKSRIDRHLRQNNALLACIWTGFFIPPRTWLASVYNMPSLFDVEQVRCNRFCTDRQITISKDRVEYGLHAQQLPARAMHAALDEHLVNWCLSVLFVDKYVCTSWPAATHARSKSSSSHRRRFS